MIDCLVSVVIPVYNVEAYVNRCLESVVEQTYNNLQIILVDDGSPDNCPAICDEWARKDARITVIHKKNAGLGYARNTGLENAHGEFVCFVDSDDYIESTLIAECVNEAQEKKAEVVFFGNDRVSLTGSVRGERVPSTPKTVFSGSEIKDKLIPKLVSYNAKTGENWGLLLSAWCAFISMSVVRRTGWRFVSEREIISEDYYSMLELCGYIEKVAIIQRVLYHYSENDQSLSQIYRKDRYEKTKHLAVIMEELSVRIGCDLGAEIATMFLSLLMGILRQIAANKRGLGAKLEEIRSIVKDEYLHQNVLIYDFAGDDLTKRVLYWALRRKLVVTCYILAVVRNLKG